MDRLFERVYDDLRSMARNLLAGSGGPGRVEATALVHAACERLLDGERLAAEDRRHFFFLLGRAMHDVLVEQARSERSLKRGGRHRRVAMVEFRADDRSLTPDLVELHDALNELRAIDPDGADIVTLRFFSGRTLHEAADLMGCSFAVARRHWDYAKAWLHERLSHSGAESIEPED